MGGGKLIVITGPMFAGKTTRLLREMQKASKNRKAILFKSGIDNRGGDSYIMTHDGTRMPATVLPDGERCIATLKEISKNYDVIGIDEGQFWKASPGFSRALDELASGSKLVFVELLNLRADGKPFDVSMELMPLADRIYLLQARCSKCGKRANFTQRVMNGRETFGDEFVIGGSECYKARCREHFVKVGDVE